MGEFAPFRFAKKFKNFQRNGEKFAKRRLVFDTGVHFRCWRPFFPEFFGCRRIFANGSECLKCPEDKWPDSRKEKCLPKIIQFLSFEETLGSALATISVLFCLLTFSVFCLFIVKQGTPIVKANNRELSYLLLISLMFGFLCSLVFIGRPNLITCMIRQVLFAIIFSLCVSALLAKTITVILIFSATNPDSKLKKLVGLKIPIYIVPVCTMIQIILCIIWLTQAAPFAEFNMASEIGKILIECNEGSRVLFACVLGYMELNSKQYITVFAVADALHQMKNCVPRKDPFKNGSYTQVHHHQPWQEMDITLPDKVNTVRLYAHVHSYANVRSLIRESVLTHTHICACTLTHTCIRAGRAALQGGTCGSSPDGPRDLQSGPGLG
ncbi:hypothetical protein XELAEV_18042701mg [Xenopus laevis]|uniref:G-protein coupled receptors family 3 profile domain-containing protein n=1 Tax=Xenopus laevis TaxID=8355 RepID=A0A974C5T1_XENLA|nr:hypothetical protein XELAEV_18042701mg [Xenopus laevis]